MKLQRKALIRNLVIGVIAVDAVGIYMLKDRLSDPSQNSISALEQEALALAASPAPQGPNLPPLPGTSLDEAPKAAAAPAALASRELPKPAFGTADATPAAAPRMAEAPRAVAAPAPAKAKPVAAPALAKAPAAAAAPAKPAAKAAPQTGFVTKRTITVPRVAAAVTTKAPVTVSTRTVASPRFAKVTERKRASFTKAFGVSQAAPAVSVASTSGSLYPASPSVSAEFGPDSSQQLPEAVEVSTLAIATHADTMANPAPSMEPAPAAPVSAPVTELPASGE